MTALLTPRVIGLVIGLVLLVSIRAVWRATMPPRTMKRGAARCEACGYSVIGLEKLRCPECGADLRVVGIATQAMEVKRRGSYSGAILGLACIVALLWVLLEYVVVDYALTLLSSPPPVPRQVLPDDGMVRAELVPVSRPSQPLKFYEYWSAEDVDDLYVLGLAMDDAEGRDWVLRLDRRGSSCELRDPQGATIHTAERIDVESVRLLYEHVGLDVHDAVVAGEIEDLHLLLLTAGIRWSGVQDVQRFPTKYFTPGEVDLGYYAPVRAPPMSQREKLILMVASVAQSLTIVLWIAGALVIIRRRRRLLRTLVAVVPAPSSR